MSRQYTEDQINAQVGELKALLQQKIDERTQVDIENYVSSLKGAVDSLSSSEPSLEAGDLRGKLDEIEESVSGMEEDLKKLVGYSELVNEHQALHDENIPEDEEEVSLDHWEKWSHTVSKAKEKKQSVYLQAQQRREVMNKLTSIIRLIESLGQEELQRITKKKTAEQSFESIADNLIDYLDKLRRMAGIKKGGMMSVLQSIRALRQQS